MQKLIDTHCHILPGVDDGPADSQSSLEMAAIAAADGISMLVATPHILEGIYDGDDLADRLAELQQLIDEKGIRIRLVAGAEVPMSLCLSMDAQRLKQLSIAGGDHLMMETAEASFEQLSRTTYQVRLNGLYPILAHPERTAFVQSQPERLVELASGGEVFCQLTAASLEGRLGRRIQKTAVFLLRAGAVHLVATDAHSTSRRPPRLSQSYEIARNAIGDEAARTIFEINPARLVDGSVMDSILGLAGKESNRGFWARLLGRKK